MAKVQPITEYLYPHKSQRFSGRPGTLSEVEALIDQDIPARCSLCAEPASVKGMCPSHYLKDRERAFHESYEAVPWSGCWIWTGPANEAGYGVLGVGRTGILAHRFSWALENKRAINAGMFICHSCDVPACVNPYHLFEGTARENNLDSMRKNRKVKTLTPEKVRMIYRMDDSGIWTLRDIARVSGVDPGRVRGILDGTVWNLGILRNY